MPPYQIVLALLQDSVLPLGRSSAVRCWRQVELFCVILLIFWNSQKVHWITIFILCANVHTKMIMILHGKNEANFFKTRRWVSKNFFFLMFKAVAYVVLRFYPIFYLPLMSWNEGIFWACHQIFSSQKRLKPLSLALFSFVVHSEFFFHVDLSQKSLLFDWSRNEHDIHRGSCHKRRPPLFVAPHQNASFKKNQFFVKSPCACFIQRVGSKLPMVNNHGVANNLIVIFFTF